MGTPKLESSSFAWYSWMSIFSSPVGRDESQWRDASDVNRVGRLHDVMCEARRCGVDHLAVKLWGAEAGRAGVVARCENPMGALHFYRGRREKLVGLRNLRWRDCPLALDAERGPAPRGGGEPVRVLEVAERAIDRT